MGERTLARKILLYGTLLLSIFFLAGCTAEVNTAVLPNQNLVYTQAVETIVAELTPPSPTQTAAALATEKAMNVVTPTPVLTATPTPTPTVQPTPTLPTIPIFHSDIPLFCLAGPGNGYSVAGYLAPGQEAEITAQSSPAGWWQIPNPRQHRNAPLEYCWVWAKGGTVPQSTVNIPVVNAPPLTTPVP